MGDDLLPELTDEEKQLLDDPKLYALLCRTAAYRRKHDECVRLRAENERLREEVHCYQNSISSTELDARNRLEIEEVKNAKLRDEVKSRGNLLLRWLMDNHLGIESDDDTFTTETMECLGLTYDDLEAVAESGDY